MGSERFKLLEIFRHMEDSDQSNIIWITTDVQFTEVFEYKLFDDADELIIHEAVSGVLNAR